MRTTLLFTILTLATTATAQETTNILIYGDSLTAGYGINKEDAYPALLQQKATEAGFDVKITNGGVSGDTSFGGLRRLDWTLRQRVDILLLELGANDGLRGISVDETKANLAKIIERTQGKYPGARILIAGMMLPPSMGAEYTSAFQKIFPDLASEKEADLIPFLLEGVAGVAELNQLDGIHPTEEGHKVIAEHVWPFLKKMLEQP